jgi:glycosyltransferase involved in cell wall biosynthesis
MEQLDKLRQLKSSGGESLQVRLGVLYPESHGQSRTIQSWLEATIHQCLVVMPHLHVYLASRTDFNSGLESLPPQLAARVSRIRLDSKVNSSRRKHTWQAWCEAVVKDKSKRRARAKLHANHLRRLSTASSVNNLRVRQTKALGRRKSWLTLQLAMARCLSWAVGKPGAILQPSWQSQAMDLECDLWLVPHTDMHFCHRVPAIVFTHSDNESSLDGDALAAIAGNLQSALAFVHPEEHGIQLAHHVPPEDRRRLVCVPGASASPPDAQAWRPVIAEATTLAKRQRNMPSAPRRRRIVLFQHTPYKGGVWEATKLLLRSLVKVNRRRNLLELVLAVHPQQQDWARLQQELPDLSIIEVDPVVVGGPQLQRTLDESPLSNNITLSGPQLFFNGDNGALIEADAWCALIDRFQAPLAPLKPYAVLIHDMIQRHVPEGFNNPKWHRMVREGMTPTIRGAHRVFTTSDPTGQDVMEEYGIAADRLRVQPLAYDAAARFDNLPPLEVEGVNGPFVLNVANGAPHKGAEVLVRGFAAAKQKAGWENWCLVVCGYQTDLFQATARISPRTHFAKIQRLVKEFGLVDGRDVRFLGYVSNRQLKWLFEHCGIVVNAGRYDNGSFSMVEGAWFGKPVVSSRHPAAEYLDARFGIEARFFEDNSPQSLATELEELRQQLPLDEQTVCRRRHNVERHEVSLELYGERFYEALVELAEGKSAPESARKDSLTPLARAG